MKKKVRGGRPPKFDEESGPITVTLPRRVVQMLESIDTDRAKAIVKCVDGLARRTWPEEKQVEVVEIAKGTGLIVVGPSQCLQDISWLKFIEIAPLRYLLAVPTGTAIESLEIAILDQIERLPECESAEKTLLTELRQKLSHHRRKEGVSKGEILYIETE